MFPKVIAFETSGVLFSGNLREDVWGKGPGASRELANNIVRVDERLLRDKSNRQNIVKLYEDVPRIIHDVLKNGAALAIVSKLDNKALCDRALYYFHADDPTTNQSRSIIHMVRYDEVVNEDKTKHFGRIKHWSRCDYNQMMYFDKTLDADLLRQGVPVATIGQSGLTWDLYTQGIQAWQEQLRTSNRSPTLQELGKKQLKIAHFNDVYKVSEQLQPGESDKDKTINVSKFATMLSDTRRSWETSGYGKGLTIFSGDVFSPSIHSSISRGHHMTPVLKALEVDVGVVGNHEFDFGYLQLAALILNTKFPWLLSNVIDTETGTVPKPLQEFHVMENSGVRIGLIGLVEREWLATITGWPKRFEWKDMTEVGMKLSQVLRDKSGPHKCDVIFALTHSRVPNDIKLARDLNALSPKAQSTEDIASQHGVDLLLGGHDHFYWISKGVSSWEGYTLGSQLEGGQNDSDIGDVLVVKSGTDFQELSEITLVLKPTSSAVRRMVIESINGKRHANRWELREDANMKQVVDAQVASINRVLPYPICVSEVDLPQVSRLGESIVGNWVADCLKPMYNEVLSGMNRGPVDGVIICTGDIRGTQSGYPKGAITLENILDLVPFTDPMVVLEISGKDLWEVMESALWMYPKTEGRFPAIAGFRVSWKSSNKEGSRVQGIWLQKESHPGKNQSVAKGEEVLRTSDRKYIVAVGGYMAEGGDGYDILKNQEVILGEENGQPKSLLILKFLTGAHWINKVTRDPKTRPEDIKLQETLSVISHARKSEALKAQVPLLPSLDPPSSPAGAPTISPYSIRLLPQGGLYYNPVYYDPATDSLPGNSVNDRSPAPDPELVQSIQESVLTFKWTTSSKVLTFAMKVAEHEDMALVDVYERLQRGTDIEGATISVVSKTSNSAEDILALMSSRTDAAEGNISSAPTKEHQVPLEGDLPRISPVLDGRLYNEDQNPCIVLCDFV